MKLSALISMLQTQLTNDQRDKLAERAEWVVLNRRNGRVLIDIVGEREDLQWIVDKLTAANLDPIVCAAWRFDTGQRIKTVPVNMAAYLAVAPDVVAYDADGNETSRTRPAGYTQTHAWAGWAWKTMTVEPD